MSEDKDRETRGFLDYFLVDDEPPELDTTPIDMREALVDHWMERATLSEITDWAYSYLTMQYEHHTDAEIAREYRKITGRY